MTTTSEIAKAFVKAQQEFNPAVKNSENNFYAKVKGKPTYVDLTGCYQAVMSALHKYGIGIIQKTHEYDGFGVKVETIFIHESGETLSAGIFAMPSGKQDAHGVMGALTYARRGSLMSACGLAPEDDDGNSAMSKEQLYGRQTKTMTEKVKEASPIKSKWVLDKLSNGKIDVKDEYEFTTEFVSSIKKIDKSNIEGKAKFALSDKLYKANKTMIGNLPEFKTTEIVLIMSEIKRKYEG